MFLKSLDNVIFWINKKKQYSNQLFAELRHNYWY